MLFASSSYCEGLIKSFTSKIPVQNPAVSSIIRPITKGQMLEGLPCAIGFPTLSTGVLLVVFTRVANARFILGLQIRGSSKDQKRTRDVRSKGTKLSVAYFQTCKW